MTVKATWVDLVCYIELWQPVSMSNNVSLRGRHVKLRIIPSGTINIPNISNSVFVKYSKQISS